MGKSTSTWPPRVPTGFRPSQRTTARLGRFPNVSVRRQLHAFGLDQLGQRRAGQCVRLPEDEARPEIDRFRLPAGAGGVDPAAGLPQVLEMTFAIFTNVLDVDENGLVTSTDAAHHRAAQWIRARHDPSYRIDPPLQAWETEVT